MIVFLYCQNDAEQIFEVSSCSPRVAFSHGTYKSDIHILSEKTCELKGKYNRKTQLCSEQISAAIAKTKQISAQTSPYAVARLRQSTT